MTNLCLTVPADATPDVTERLTAALRQTAIASVVIEPADDAPLSAERVLPLVAIAQAAGAAALLSGDAALARVVKADGVHLPWSDDIVRDYEEARSILGRGAIVGVDAGTSRHDAMTLGEAGADYVAFAAGADAATQDVQLERITWWAEIFEVPVVAFAVANARDATDLAARGADFVSVPLANLTSEIVDALAVARHAPVA